MEHGKININREWNKGLVQQAGLTCTLQHRLVITVTVHARQPMYDACGNQQQQIRQHIGIINDARFLLAFRPSLRGPDRELNEWPQGRPGRRKAVRIERTTYGTSCTVVCCVLYLKPLVTGTDTGCAKEWLREPTLRCCSSSSVGYVAGSEKTR